MSAPCRARPAARTVARLLALALVVLLVPACSGTLGGGLYFFGTPLNTDAELEARAARTLGCNRAEIGAEVEADDGTAFTICCARRRRSTGPDGPCMGYFCPNGGVCHAY